MDLLRTHFREPPEHLLYFIEIEDSNKYWLDRHAWISATKREADKLGIRFQHKEYPEGFALLFETDGDYDRLMASLDVSLQQSAETYRRNLIGRARRWGEQFPEGFDEEYAIKHGKPFEGYEPQEP